MENQRQQILNRPNSLEYMKRIFTDFIEMSGDRLFGEDCSLIGGLAQLEQKNVTVLAQVIGRNPEENAKVRHSMVNPEGYRKSLRLMKQSEKFGRPVICLVDTVGACPGEAAEKRGQAAAIANNIMEMMAIGVPVFSIVIGNGGSGGALALCASNAIAMLEDAYLSVISPKGCANILWRDSSRMEEAAMMLKMTATDLMRYRAIDLMIPRSDVETTAESIKRFLVCQIHLYDSFSREQVIDMRHRKFRDFGQEYLDLYSDKTDECGIR